MQDKESETVEFKESFVGFFSARFERKGVEKGVEKLLSEKEKIILELLQNNPTISKKQIEKSSKLKKKAIDYNIAKLKRKKIIKRVGSDKGGQFILLFNLKPEKSDINLKEKQRGKLIDESSDLNSSLIDKKDIETYGELNSDVNSGVKLTELQTKTSEKGSEKIIQIIKENSQISAKEIGVILGLTSRAVEMQLSRLKAEGKIKRVGPDKGGRWVVLG
ncbi:MAG: winged helix-turn-helix transcriptional regulator [Nanohaloarchaea archaeon]|nr:winged helix-turn-helix transcriptional regulator [Candidatus Nanohaloarchaea archaeon]